MDRNAYGRPRTFERRERFRIPRDDGRAQFLEAMMLLVAVAAMGVVLGLAVGVPLAIIVNDICASIKC